MQVEGRPADDLEHVGGRRLLLQCLGEIACPGPHLVEQAGVLDCNDRLVCESLNEFDLTERKSTGFGAHQRKHAVHFAVANERRSKDGPIVADPGTLAKVVVWVGQDIRNVYRLARHHHPAADRFLAGLERMLLCVFDKFRVTSRLRAKPHKIAVKHLDVGAGGATERPGGIGQRLENCVQIERRTADHLQDVGGRLLLLQRFPRFVEESDIVDRDDRLISEGLEKLDLPLGERTHDVTADINGADRFAIAQHWYG